MKNYHVLSMKQPWASLLVTPHPNYKNGIKEWETRSWSTDYRGELLIHASKDKSCLDMLNVWPFNLYRHLIEPLPFGMIIGKVVVSEIITTEKWMESYFFTDSHDHFMKNCLQERAFGDYGNDRYAWKVDSPVKLIAPIPATGSLSIWKFKMPDLIEMPLDSGGTAMVDPWIKSAQMQDIEKAAEKAERIWKRHQASKQLTITNLK